MLRLRSQRGFTVIEMLVAMGIILIVSLAAFSLIDIVMRRTGEINARVDATSRGRLAMSYMMRDLRSQVCAVRGDVTMASQRAVYAGNNSSVTFFEDLGNQSYKGGVTTDNGPGLVTLSLANGIITETTQANTAAAGNINYTYTGPAKNRQVLTDVTLYNSTPLFQYYAWNPAETNPTVPDLKLATPLTEANAANVALVRVTFKANPTRTASTIGSVVFTDDDYVRMLDPNIMTADDQARKALPTACQ